MQLVCVAIGLDQGKSTALLDKQTETSMFLQEFVMKR